MYSGKSRGVGQRAAFEVQAALTTMWQPLAARHTEHGQSEDNVGVARLERRDAGQFPKDGNQL